MTREPTHPIRIEDENERDAKQVDDALRAAGQNYAEADSDGDLHYRREADVMARLFPLSPSEESDARLDAALREAERADKWAARILIALGVIAALVLAGASYALLA